MKKVVKFGGSSLASADQIIKAVHIIKEDPTRKFIVLSAPGKRDNSDTKVTDMLYECYKLASEEKEFLPLFNKIKARYTSIINDLNLTYSLESEFEIIEENFKMKAGADYAASRGEYLNSLVIAQYLEFPFVDAAKMIVFDDDGNFDSELTNSKVKEALGVYEYAVVPGFYGAMPNGVIKTFSRGGSDITGSIVARAVEADLYENWTDVSGFLVADPRIVENPKPISVITYKELRELAYMGATVLHEEAIFPVRRDGIPINIKNTNKPEDKGTLIVEDTIKQSKYILTGIAGKKGFAAINIEKAMMNSEVGFCKTVLDVFQKYNIPVEHMPSGIDTFSVIVHQDEIEDQEQQMLSDIYKAVKPDVIEVQSELALIAVVGRSMKSNRGTAGRIFSALSHANVDIKLIDLGSSALNVIIGVQNQDFDTAIKAIYDIFVETQLKVRN